jgi:hypothetical protein
LGRITTTGNREIRKLLVLGAALEQRGRHLDARGSPAPARQARSGEEITPARWWQTRLQMWWPAGRALARCHAPRHTGFMLPRPADPGLIERREVAGEIDRPRGFPECIAAGLIGFCDLRQHGGRQAAVGTDGQYGFDDTLAIFSLTSVDAFLNRRISYLLQTLILLQIAQLRRSTHYGLTRC